MSGNQRENRGYRSSIAIPTAGTQADVQLPEVPRHSAPPPDSVGPLVAELEPPPEALPRQQRMTEELFLAGFIAALRTEGLDFIETDEDAHHRHFDAAMDRLRELQKDGDTAARGMPRTLMPTPMTGRYRELDDMLLSMQRGYLSAPNPFYAGIRLKLSQPRAAEILDRFSGDQRALLHDLATHYRADA